MDEFYSFNPTCDFPQNKANIGSRAARSRSQQACVQL
jgi:hypothetical protein